MKFTDITGSIQCRVILDPFTLMLFEASTSVATHAKQCGHGIDSTMWKQSMIQLMGASTTACSI
jgi:hypothetical protein